MATAKAAQLLTRHHGSMPPNAVALGAMDVLYGPRAPEWTCQCGEDANWASRIRCKACAKPAPTRVVQAAKAAAAKQRSPQPARHGEPHGTRSTGAGSEVQQLKRELAELKAQLRTPHGDVAGKDEEPGDEDEAAKRENLQKELGALKSVLGDDHPEVQSRKQALDELYKQKPVGTRLIAAQRRIDRSENKVEQKDKAIAEALERIKEAQQELADHRGQKKVIQDALDKQKKELASIVEAEASSQPQTGQDLDAFNAWLGAVQGKDGSLAELVASVEVVKAALERSKCEQEEQAKTDAEASAEPAAEPASALSPAAKQVQAVEAPQPDLGNEDTQMAMDGDEELGTLLAPQGSGQASPLREGGIVRPGHRP